MIDLRAIREATLQRAPFRHALIRSLLSRDQVVALRRALPRENYSRSARASGSDKTYNVINNVIFPLEEQRPAPGVRLEPPWAELLSDLSTPAYVAALSELLDEDLGPCCREVTIKRYGHGDYISSHTDTAAVRATHLLFFNLEWEPSWGGQLRLLRDATSSFREIAPHWSECVAFVRSEHSWHDVVAVAEPGVERVGLQVVFWNQRSRHVAPGRVEVSLDG
ncbi:2OG-Fe(II) oxygenase [Sorangium sp. So ce1128]